MADAQYRVKNKWLNKMLVDEALDNKRSATAQLELILEERYGKEIKDKEK